MDNENKFILGVVEGKKYCLFLSYKANKNTEINEFEKIVKLSRQTKYQHLIHFKENIFTTFLLNCFKHILFLYIYEQITFYCNKSKVQNLNLELFQKYFLFYIAYNFS